LARLSARLDGRIRAVLRGDSHKATKVTAQERDTLRYAALLAGERDMPADQVARALGLDGESVAALTGTRFLEGLTGGERLSVEHSMPVWLVGALLQRWPHEHVGNLLAALNSRAPLYVRARGPRDVLMARLAKEGVSARVTPFSPLGVELLSHINVRALSAFKEALFEVQDLGSQIIAMAVAPKPGEWVVDLCAGAGGKTLALCALAPQARVVAMEPDARRFQALNERAQRAGLRLETYCASAQEASQGPLRGRADAVLVDAPCSGTGVLRREPENRWRYSSNDIMRFARTQCEIVCHAASLLRPGGRLVYATCSLLPAEDEDVVSHVLETQPALKPLLLSDVMGTTADALGAQGHQLHLWPHVHGTDGFFVATLVRCP
jgi:16S rRNA (cytosine967-C5)-methyltransferase